MLGCCGIGEGLVDVLAEHAALGLYQSIVRSHIPEDNVDIQRAGSNASIQGPSDWFTGDVRIDPVFEADEPGRAAGVSVTFEPGARTAWHTHPLGQTLIITSGLGRVQREGGSIEEVRPGDVVSFAAGEKHWHGASPKTAMSHLAIHERRDGSAVAWLEHVSDDQYDG